MVQGEIGHTTIDPTGRRCKCGNYGCLEAYASGPAIAERAREELEVEGDSILHGMVEGTSAKSPRRLFLKRRSAEIQSPLPLCATRRIFSALGLSNLINVFNPDIVVVAGGVTQAGDLLFDPLRAEIKRRAFKSSVDACKVVPGALPLSAGVVGAVAAFNAQLLGDH
jgi:glucokinase